MKEGENFFNAAEPGSDEMLMADSEESDRFRTPGMVGRISKLEKSWVVSTEIPSVPHARIIKGELDPNFDLIAGKQVSYDLITQIDEEKTRYFATNLHNYRKEHKQKVKGIKTHS